MFCPGCDQSVRTSDVDWRYGLQQADLITGSACNPESTGAGAAAGEVPSCNVVCMAPDGGSGGKNCYGMHVYAGPGDTAVTCGESGTKKASSQTCHDLKVHTPNNPTDTTSAAIDCSGCGDCPYHWCQNWPCCSNAEITPPLSRHVFIPNSTGMYAYQVR